MAARIADLKQQRRSLKHQIRVLEDKPAGRRFILGWFARRKLKSLQRELAYVQRTIHDLLRSAG